MEHYVGLDVSLKLTAICIANERGKIQFSAQFFPGKEKSYREAYRGLCQVNRIGRNEGRLARWLK